MKTGFTAVMDVVVWSPSGDGRAEETHNMGHAFLCEYCDCFHTATDGCDEYDQNRANRILVNNETQKENKMALEDNHKDVLESLREYNESRAAWLQCEDSLCVDAAKEIAKLRVENDRLSDEAYTARQAAKGENALRLEAERERNETMGEPKGCAMPGCCAAVDVIAELRAEVERIKEDHGSACQLVAQMHAAAAGEVTGPNRGVVEDVEDLRLRVEAGEGEILDLFVRAEKAERERNEAREVVKLAINWFSQITSSDGSGHADLGRRLQERLDAAREGRDNE